MTKVSIIVPIYNVELYLQKCLNSILAQTMTDIEVICVNDGSTDNSLHILQQCSALDKRIKVINQRNQGISAARNAGLDVVTSEYVMFVDSDDYIAADMVEKLYNSITKNNTDVALCHIKCINQLSPSAAPEVIEWQSWIQPWCDEYAKPSGVYRVPYNIKAEFVSTVWNKLYKTALIKKYNLRFPLGLIQEDEYWLWAYMLHCDTYSYVNEQLYFYVQRSGSIMTSRTANTKIYDILEIMRLIYVHIAEYADIAKYSDILADLYTKTVKEEILNYGANINFALLQQKVREYMDNYNQSAKIKNFYLRLQKNSPKR